MPRKIRQLRADLRRAGFSLDPDRGKGSHTVWTHLDFPGIVTLAGHDGDDAQHYQEKDVRDAIAEVRQRKPLSKGSKEITMQQRNGIGQDDVVAQRYALVIEWSDEDQVFIVSAPDLPGLRTHGATRVEALAMGEEAVALWLGANKRLDRAAPPAGFTVLPYAVRPEAAVREVANVGR